jgi:TRAP-type C4-dicarboxylate transport system permease small subunit
MTALRREIDRILALVVVSIMAILVITVLWQVFSRYFLPQPSPWTEETSRFLLIWVTMLGAAYLTGQHGHIAIDLVSGRLSPRGARNLQTFIRFTVLFFAFAAFCVGGANLIYITLSLGQSSAVLGIPLGYVYTVIPASGILIGFYTAHDLLVLRASNEPPSDSPPEEAH